MTQANTSAPMANWVRNGAIMGIVAGLIFAAFEVIVAGILQGNFFGPLRMMSAVVLGNEALDASYPLAGVLIAGLGVHIVLSAVYGTIFGGVAGALPKARQNRPNLVWIASASGLLLWLVNFYVIAPLVFPWFTNANPVVQFIAHTFFFGTALGLLLTTRNVTAREIPGERPAQRGHSQEPVHSQR